MVGLDLQLIEEGRKVTERVSDYCVQLKGLFNWTTDIGSDSGIDQNAHGLHESGAVPKVVVTNHCYPFLFADEFPLVPLQDVRKIAVAGCFYMEHLLMQDKLIDGHEISDGPSRCRFSLKSALYHEESIAILQSLFVPESPFWCCLEEYHKEFARAVFVEATKHVGRMSPYPLKELWQIAMGKSALAKAATAALALLAHEEEKIAPLALTQDWAAVGLQLHDDLKDWKTDYQRGHYSYVLTRAIFEGGFEEEVASGDRPDIDAIGRTLYYSGLADAVLDEVDHAYQEALRNVIDMNCPHWVDYIRLLLRQCSNLKADLNEIANRNLEQARKRPRFDLTLPPPCDEWQGIAWDALRFIIRQWQLGFGEARHMMRLIVEEGFNTDREFHYGDVFQRALIADTLCDVNALLDDRLHPVIEHEVDHLKDSRLTYGVGGWSYFPSLPELSPDADDLGQVMQVLLRSGHQEDVATYCEKPLTVLLQDNAHPDGSFETWIVPATGRTPQQERQAEFNLSHWGAGPHNEVIANLLYALVLYDSERYAEVIQHGIAYLETQQDDDGSWESRWYYGLYYGTYVCLRLFAATRPASLAIHRAVHFLQKAQLLDGGWGWDGTSDPLSTSLALLGLASAQRGSCDTDDLDRAHQALSYLRHVRAPDNSWSNVRFIRPRMNDPYGSRSITTMYVLKAATAWHRLTQSSVGDCRDLAVAESDVIQVSALTYSTECSKA
jgi:squalene-hopene/tetraprenyl-beta-curcumene cyclase